MRDSCSACRYDLKRSGTDEFRVAPGSGGAVVLSDETKDKVAEGTKAAKEHANQCVVCFPCACML